MISLIVCGVGAIVAAVGSGVLLARCFREPRGDIITWSVALLGLLISLGSQALGHLTGFDSAMFRGMEVGGQVVAPLALILGLSEVAARSAAVRFCARLYVTALAIVGIVILSLDQLSSASFSKAWPDPSAFYQVPPDYVLMFAIGPVTALVAVVAAGTVLARSSQPGWNAVLPAQLMGAGAALALAYPCLAQLVAYVAGIHLPVSSEFAVLCALAAGLIWMAGVRTGRVRLSVLHGRSAAASRDGAGRFSDRDQADDFGRLEPAAERGLYRDDGLYWQERADQGASTSRRGYSDDPRGLDESDDWRSAGEPGSQYGAGYRTPEFATGDFATGDFATGDHDLGYPAGGQYDRTDGQYDRTNGQHGYGDEQYGHGDGVAGGWHEHGGGGRDRLSAAPARAAADASRAELFGQIAIYTLLEDRVNEFDQLTEWVVEQVRSREPDTLVFIVHAVPSAPMQRILYEVYRDRAAYQRHTQQPYVRQFDADRRPYVLATNVIELGLQQAKVSPFPSVAELFGEPGYDTSGFERPDFLRDYGRTSGQQGSNGRRDFG